MTTDVGVRKRNSQVLLSAVEKLTEPLPSQLCLATRREKAVN